MTLTEFMDSDEAPPMVHFDIPWEITWAVDYQRFMDRIQEEGWDVREYDASGEAFVDYPILAVQTVRMGNRFIARQAYEGRPMTNDGIAELRSLLRTLYDSVLILHGRIVNARHLRMTLYGLLHETMLENNEHQLARVVLDARDNLRTEARQVAVSEIINRLIGTAWALHADRTIQGQIAMQSEAVYFYGPLGSDSESVSESE